MATQHNDPSTIPQIPMDPIEKGMESQGGPTPNTDPAPPDSGGSQGGGEGGGQGSQQPSGE